MQNLSLCLDFNEVNDWAQIWKKNLWTYRVELFYYFPGSGSGDQPSGAYIFRPDSQEKHFHNITKVYRLRWEMNSNVTFISKKSKIKVDLIFKRVNGGRIMGRNRIWMVFIHPTETYNGQSFGGLKISDGFWYPKSVWRQVCSRLFFIFSHIWQKLGEKWKKPCLNCLSTHYSTDLNPNPSLFEIIELLLSIKNQG